MNSVVVIFSGVVAFIAVLVINFIKEAFLKSKKKFFKERYKEMYETVELHLFRFPVDINEIANFSKTRREDAIKAVEIQTKMLEVTEEMMSDIPFLRKSNDCLSYVHLRNLLLNAKQCIKNLEEQLEAQNKCP